MLFFFSERPGFLLSPQVLLFFFLQLSVSSLIFFENMILFHLLLLLWWWWWCAHAHTGVCVRIFHDIHVEVKGQLPGVYSLLPPCGLWGLNAGQTARLWDSWAILMAVKPLLPPFNSPLSTFRSPPTISTTKSTKIRRHRLKALLGRQRKDVLIYTLSVALWDDWRSSHYVGGRLLNALMCYPHNCHMNLTLLFFYH